MPAFRNAALCFVVPSGTERLTPETILRIGTLDPQHLTLNFLGSYSLVGIGKFDLVFLWLIGVGRNGSDLQSSEKPIDLLLRASDRQDLSLLVTFRV